MAFDLSLVTSYEELVTAQPSQKKELWSDMVKLDARNLNVFKLFIGAEESGNPIVEKRDLAAGGAAKVTFTTTAPVRMAGTMGEDELKSHTGTLEFEDFSVTVDLRRFAISHNQLLKYLRFNKNKDPKTLSYDLCVELWGRMEMDDLQIKLRNTALYAADQANVFYIGGGTGVNDLTLGDTMDTTIIEKGANQLEGQGAVPMSVAKDPAGYDVPQYLLFGPKTFFQPLQNETKFREALNYTLDRSTEHPNWTGKFPMWNNNIVYRHAVVYDSANGRQGSPLQPIAFLGVALANGSATEVTGGGKYNVAGDQTDAVLFDYFSYFPGYWWKTHKGDTAPSDSATYYAIIYNVTGANRGKYEIISYAAAGISANKLGTVIREIDADSQKTALTAAGRYSAVHPNGSLIIPCNKWGVPLCYAVHMGADAMFMAKGAIDAQRIRHGDDFQNDEGQWHVDAVGIQGIRGYAAVQDTISRFPNFLVVVGAREIPGLDLVDLTAT